MKKFARRRILYRLLFGIVPVTVGALVVSFLFSRYFLDKMVDRYVPDSNIKAAEIVSLKVSGYVNSARGSLSDLSSAIAHEDSPAKKGYLVRQLLLRSPVFKNIYVIGRDGTIIADTSIGSMANRQKVSETATLAFSGKEVISGVVFSDAAMPYVEICAPVTKWRKVVSALCGEVDFISIWEIMDTTKIGKTGYATLISKDGRYLYHPDKAVVLKGQSISRRSLLRMREAVKGSFVYANMDKRDVLAAFSSVEGLDWKAVVNQDSTEVFQFWLSLRRYLLLFLILMTISVSAFVYIFSRRIALPIEELTRATKIISSGDLQHTITVNGHDEIGVLADSFNAMMLELKKKQNILIHSEKLSAIGRFAASLAHEIQNPISGLIGYVYLLKRKQPEEKVFEFANDMEEELIHIQSTLKRLLSLSNQSEIRFEDISLNSAVERCMKLVEHHFSRYKKVAISAELDETLPCVRGDKILLQQATLNLLLNAGEEVVENGRIRISTWHEGDQVFLEVQDDGEGIEENEIELLFEPFFSTKVSSGGTGLGLYVTNEIVKLHNADIKVVSKRGDTRFTLIFNA